MPRSLRQTLVALLIALHAAVTLCGPGLHALPGWGHNSGLHPLAKNDHSHGPGKSSHAASDECPVCHFLAQGQLSSDHSGGVTASLVGDPVTPIVSIAVPISPHPLSNPRGPPPSLPA